MSAPQNDGVETPEATIARLEASLKAEHDRTTTLQAEVQALKIHQVQILATAEAQEEYITNMLLKKLEAITTERDELVQRVAVIQKEREALIVQLEQEEEYLTNTLQKKLTTVLREKIELENQLEQEEEYIVNELQKKLAKLQAEKLALEARLQEERESHETLRKTQSQLAKATQQNADLQRELAAVRGENFGLTQKISKEHQQLVSISQAKAKLEQGIELEDERAFNDESRGPRRHRTRSYSSPVRDGEAIQGDRVSPTQQMVKSSSGSSGLNTTPLSSSTSSSSSTSTSTSLSPSSSTILSPPGSPRGSPEQKHTSSGSNSSSSSSLQPGSAGTRARKLSLAAMPAMIHHYPSTPRATGTILKQGWMKSQARSKLPQADPDMDPEPSTELYFILSDNSTLEAWMNDLHGEDGTPPIFSINLDTVQRRTLEIETGELILETKDTTYSLRPQSEDTKEWHELLEQLDPLASGATAQSH